VVLAVSIYFFVNVNGLDIFLCLLVLIFQVVCLFFAWRLYREVTSGGSEDKKPLPESPDSTPKPTDV